MNRGTKLTSFPNIKILNNLNGFFYKNTFARLQLLRVKFHDIFGYFKEFRSQLNLLTDRYPFDHKNMNHYFQVNPLNLPVDNNLRGEPRTELVKDLGWPPLLYEE